jgi:hypothetical protein
MHVLWNPPSCLFLKHILHHANPGQESPLKGMHAGAELRALFHPKRGLRPEKTARRTLKLERGSSSRPSASASVASGPRKPMASSTRSASRTSALSGTSTRLGRPPPSAGSQRTCAHAQAYDLWIQERSPQ